MKAMKVSLDTKLNVNSYTVKKFNNKDKTGYIYFKLFLEICLEKYKELGYVPNYTLAELVKLAGIKEPASNCQRSIDYFLKCENIDKNFSNALVQSIEEIIDMIDPTIGEMF